VLNHWFYVLTQGESGTNEGGNAYAVTGIGINSAAKIAYRAESAYLQASSKFEDARRYTQLAAEELFGVCSAEAIATANAWLAVGVGDGSYVGTPPTPDINAQLVSGYNEPTMVQFLVYNPPLGVTYNWYVNGTFNKSTTINEFRYYFPCNVTRTITCALSSCNGTSGMSNGSSPTGECNRTKPPVTYNYAPNPASDEVVVSASSPTAASSLKQGLASNASSTESYFSVQLYNTFGQQVRSGSSENGKVRLNLRDLPSGLYTLRAGSGAETLNAHIQVAH